MKQQTLRIIERFLVSEGVDFVQDYSIVDDKGYEMVWRLYFPDLNLVIRPAKWGEYNDKRFLSHVKYCRQDLELTVIVVNSSIQHILMPYISTIIQKSMDTQGAYWNFSNENSILGVFKFLEIDFIKRKTNND